MRRRAAIEPVIGHLKDDHRMRRNHLKGRDGDRINAVLAAAGYNFNLLLRWFEEFLRATFLIVLSRLLAPTLRLNRPSKTFFTVDSLGLTPRQQLKLQTSTASEELGEATSWQQHRLKDQIYMAMRREKPPM